MTSTLAQQAAASLAELNSTHLTKTTAKTIAKAAKAEYDKTCDRPHIAVQMQGKAPTAPINQPITIDPTAAALLAVWAGAELDVHKGLRFDGEAMPSSIVGWFLAGAYGAHPGTKRDGEMILVAARGLALIELHQEAAADVQRILEAAQRMADNDLINPARLASLQVSEVLRRLEQVKKKPAFT
jgi:hypothetical protein